MIFSSVLFFLVAVTISVVTSANNTYTRDASTGQLVLAYGQECVRPGQMCEDCQKVVYCVEISGGNFVKQDLYECHSGQTCLNTVNDCSVEPNPICDDFITKYKFICHQTGMFPDAEDCTKYHICVAKKVGGLRVFSEPYTEQCEAGFSYDPKTTLCRNKFTTGTECKRVAPVCSVAGETGVIPNSPNHYYICLSSNGSAPYFPHMFKCPQNQEFFEGACVDPFPLPPFDPNLPCAVKGFFVYPTSCLHYYNCAVVNGKPTVTQCPGGTKFDFRTLTCVPITCLNM